MRKFKIRLSYNTWAGKFEEILSLRRKFQKLEIDLNGEKELMLFLDISQRHGSQIRSLKIHKAGFRDLKEFVIILQNMPLLEDLNIEGFKLLVNEKSTIEPVTMKNLQDLCISYWSDWSVFDCIRVVKLKSLKIALSSGKENRNCLENFLLASEKLETLNIDDSALTNLFKASTQFGFRLKQFSTYSQKQISKEVADNLIKFFESQASSLEKIDWKAFPHSVLDSVLAKNMKLKILKLDSLPANKAFYDKLKPIENLKEFDAGFIPDEALGIMGNIPNLEVLKVHNRSDLIPFLSLNNRKLKKLSIQEFKSELPAVVKFKELKYFYVEYCSNIEALIPFLTNNSSIETYCERFFNERHLENGFIEILLNMPSMKHLKLGGETSALQAAFNIIKTNPKQLQTLELLFEKVPGRPDIIFQFPGDASKWEEKCPFLKNYVKNAESEFGYRISVSHISEFMH